MSRTWSIAPQGRISPDRRRSLAASDPPCAPPRDERWTHNQELRARDRLAMLALPLLAALRAANNPFMDLNTLADLATILGTLCTLWLIFKQRRPCPRQSLRTPPGNTACEVPCHQGVEPTAEGATLSSCNTPDEEG